MYAEIEVREMKIQEVCNLLNLTKKAIYYYEERGLLNVHKDDNGYRIFNDYDIQRLREISLYRKLDIEIAVIKLLLEKNEDEKRKNLEVIYHQKKEELINQKSSLRVLEQLISQNIDWEGFDKQIDYQNIAKAIQEQVPGIYGKLFIQHFAPYLQGVIQTKEQAEAYQRIIQFWDDVNIKIPLGIRLIYWLNRHEDESKMIYGFQQIESMKSDLLNDDEALEKSKKIMQDYYFKSKSPLFKVLNYSQRKLKIQLQNVGYNDIFIPALCRLSPEYNEYLTKWKELNTRVMQELGLYYDQKMRICKKE